MAPSKILTIFGATGNQGGSVISNVLSNSELSSAYKLRGVTRDPSKPNAQKLASQGVEMVSANMNEPASLQAAISGSYAVFAVTNYWEDQSKETEVRQGKSIADSSKEAGVKHLIWASLPHVTRLTNGELKHVDHFDSKADVEEYIESIKGGSGMIASYWQPGFFMSNIKGMINPNPKTGVPTLTMPWDAEKTQVALLDVVKDTGKFVAGLLLADAKSVDGFHVNGVSQWVTPIEIVNTLNKTAGTKVEFQQVPPDVYQGFLPEPIAQEMTENMVLVRDWSYFGKGAEKKQEESNKILGGAKLTSWEDFVKQNGPWEWK
jgi:uncharacterized protein YbjT (DUF2867 family)